MYGWNGSPILSPTGNGDLFSRNKTRVWWHLKSEQNFVKVWTLSWIITYRNIYEMCVSDQCHWCDDPIMLGATFKGDNILWLNHKVWVNARESPSVVTLLSGCDITQGRSTAYHPHSSPLFSFCRSTEWWWVEIVGNPTFTLTTKEVSYAEIKLVTAPRSPKELQGWW